MAAFVYTSDMVEGTTEDLILEGMLVQAEMRAEDNGTTVAAEMANLQEERAEEKRADRKWECVRRIIRKGRPNISASLLEELVEDWIAEDVREGIE